ncbi:fatty acid synthase-like [Aphidius gifuensis]|uniref:fatty acid synthase-like n=1 Tax=Aphidius gifuensis TaxID=684658 RepID=UPI001CDD02CE|nr:fatty acid synthase-like [Aphidius gifuensis]
MLEHCINGRILLPTTGYLVFVWQTFAMIIGNFKIIDGKTTIVTGYIHQMIDSSVEKIGTAVNIEEEKDAEQMNNSDIYQECQVRGYYYTGVFQGIKSCSINKTCGKFIWNNNWITFLDSLIQLKILSVNTENLIIPSSIEKLVIDVKAHEDDICNLSDDDDDDDDDDKSVSAIYNKNYDIVISKGVEIRGIGTSIISRKKQSNISLEYYEFVANIDDEKITLEEAIRVATHLALENNLDKFIKIFEFLDTNDSDNVKDLLSPIIVQTTNDNIHLGTEIEIVIDNNCQTIKSLDNLPQSVKIIEFIKLTDSNALMASGKNILFSNKISTILASIRDDGFILTIEKTKNLSIMLLRKHEKKTIKNDLIVIEVDDNLLCGMLGLLTSLRQEKIGEKIRGFVLQDPNAPDFDLSHPLYKNQLNLDLVMNVLRPGNTWDGPITEDFNHPDLVKIIYSAINYRDVMVATRKIPIETIARNKAEEECMLGIEYSGVDIENKKIMGLMTSRSITNLAIVDRNLSWKIPDNWSFEDAATVPCAYGIAYYALYINGNIKKGEKILIHSGSGGVGQAAIILALNENCEIFTTVGTLEKRKFIKNKFPQILDDHIGYSRDSSFENMILKSTKGRGVDIVLNSSTENTFKASIKCLANKGRFIKIGNIIMSNDTSIQMTDILSKNINGLDSDVIKPLARMVYSKNQLEDAFHKCYMIIGGLGGLGLELANWLVLRGAKNLVITCRSGIKNGYQLMRIKQWESCGTKVVIICDKNVCNYEDCIDILNEATKIAPIDESFKSKAWSTINLDKLTRIICPTLRYFVVFSSVACGKGNEGQTNYGMANSIMERICEIRKKEGFPALVIQWAAIGDAGIVARMQKKSKKELEIGGTIQQKIYSCLQLLDDFLLQSKTIVATSIQYLPIKS